MERKGIILAGGTGSRLRPLTYGVCKQLLPVYNRPMILYPINTLLTAGVQDITIISKTVDIPAYSNLLSNINPNQELFTYRFVSQDIPKGLAEAFTLAEPYISGHPSVLVLGDNLFYGETFDKDICNIMPDENLIFGYEVSDPSAYGVAILNDDNELINVIEKPKTFVSRYAIPGIYFFDESVIDKAKRCVASPRGELEIVDVIKQYIRDKNISLHKIDKHAAWFDCGTHNDLLDAANFVRAIETRTNVKICNL